MDYIWYRLGNNLSASLMAGNLLFELMANAGREYMGKAGSNPALSTTNGGRELSPLLVAINHRGGFE